MDKEFVKKWNKMLQRTRPSKEVVFEVEKVLLEKITLSEDYVSEMSNTLVISFNNTIIAGLMPHNGYQKLTPWGNFNKFLSKSFWTKLADKLVVSFSDEKSEKKISEKASKIFKHFASSISSSKSGNRAGGDYSELGVIKLLCEKYNTTFDYFVEYKALEMKLNSSIEGKEKKEKEDSNIPLLFEGVCQVIDKNNFKEITEVIWTGRSLTDGGTEDIVIKSNDKSVRISLKSIKANGMGTLKNTGANSFVGIDLDYSNLYNEMKDAVILKMSEIFSYKNFETLSDVKNYSRENAKVKELADEVSCDYLKKINEKIFIHLSSLDKQRVKDFFNSTILDQGTNDLWVVVANETGINVYNQNSEHHLGDSDELTFSEMTDKGFKVLKNGQKFIRVNTCCTNGKGLSAICQRYFFDI